MQNDWITLASLGTFGGAVFTVTLISQFLKGLVDHVHKVPTRLLVLLISWAVLLGHRQIVAGGLSFAHVYLDILNGFLVALSAMGAHGIAKDHLKWK